MVADTQFSELTWKFETLCRMSRAWESVIQQQHFELYYMGVSSTYTFKADQVVAFRLISRTKIEDLRWLQKDGQRAFVSVA